MKYAIIYWNDDAMCVSRVETEKDRQALVGMVFFRLKEIEKPEFETLSEAFNALPVCSIQDCYRYGISRLIAGNLKQLDIFNG